jgi:hypothetical protein
MKMLSFTKGTGDLVPVALSGYRQFSTSGGGEYVAGAGVEIDVVIEGYGNDEQFDGTYEYGVAVLTAEGNIRRIRTTHSSDGAGALHDFQSDFLIISAGITEEAIRRLINESIPTFTPDRVIISDGFGNLSQSNVSSSEIAFVSGVSSPIQDQINSKQNEITAGTNSQYFRGDKSFQELNTSVVPESGNLYFTEVRARNATVSDSITNGVIDVAPSQNAVFDALTGKADSSHLHIIGDVSNLQSTLDGKAPVVHGHLISDVTGLQTSLDGKAAIVHSHLISDVTNLQSSLDGKASTVHAHSISDVTNLQSELDSKASSVHSHVISDVTNLQTTLDGKAATIHAHAISDVTGLQTAIDGKAPVVHGHAISDVTNLQTELDGKEDVFLYNNATPMPSTVGGFNTGTTFSNQTLNQMFTGLLYPYQLPAFTSFAISGQSTTLEVGDAITSGAKTFTWATSNSSNINTNSIEIRNHTDNVSLASSLANDGTESISLPSPITKTTAASHVFRINGTNSQSTVFSRDFTVNWRFRIYYGESALASLNESQIESLRVSSLVSNSSGTFSFDPLGYKWFCYPTSFGLKTTFKDTSTNLDVAMEAAITVSVTNAFGVTVNYYAHRTTNQLGGAINIAVS